VDDDQNKLYSDFRTRDVLDGISADNFDSMKNEAFITPDNKDFFEDMLRTGWLSGQLSSSGPMPNTGEIASVEITVSSADSVMKAPKAGEVYQVVGISASANATLGSLSGVTLYIKLDDGTTSMTILEWSGSGSIEPPDTSYNVPLMFDNNLTLVGRIYKSGGLGAGEAVNLRAAIIRVR
jgi:hypothetical protein